MARGQLLEGYVSRLIVGGFLVFVCVCERERESLCVRVCREGRGHYSGKKSMMLFF